MIAQFQLAFTNFGLTISGKLHLLTDKNNNHNNNNNNIFTANC